MRTDESPRDNSGPGVGRNGHGRANGARTVLFVVDTLGLSGRTKGIINLALNLDPARYRPVFCTLGEESSVLVDQLKERNIPIELLPVAPGLKLSSVVPLGRLIDKHHVAVVHAVNQRPMLYAGLAAQLRGIHATVGSLSAFACQVPDREYTFLPQDLANRGRRNAWRNQAVSLLTRYLVAVSQELGERFCRFTHDAAGPVRLLGRKKLLRKLRAISYGIDIEPFTAVRPDEIAALRETLGASPDTILVGSVGRLVEQKDYPTQLRGFAEAARSEPRLRMVLGGEGPLRDEIEAMAAELGIADRVHLLGQWTQVPLLLRSLDVFVLASKFEPYGVALLEAKCAGIPIVATSVNEIPTLVADGVNGLVVPPASPEAMGAALLRLARDPALRRSLGESALDDARRRHSISAAASAYQALYDESCQ